MKSALCSVAGCDSRQYGRKTYCIKHYRRVVRHGDPSILLSENHGMAKSPEYSCWFHIIQRTTNPNTTHYGYYGGRGIYVCERWRKSFRNFYTDMGPRPTSLHSIDRIDPDGPYDPKNCRWATRTVQSINQRIRKDSSSGVKGVRKHSSGKWQTTIRLNGKEKYLGIFNTIEEAAEIRRAAELKYYAPLLRKENYEQV